MSYVVTNTQMCAQEPNHNPSFVAEYSRRFPHYTAESSPRVDFMDTRMQMRAVNPGNKYARFRLTLQPRCSTRARAITSLSCRTYSIFIFHPRRWLACRSASICEPPARLHNDISRRMMPIESTGHWKQYIPDFRFKRDIQITLFQWARVFARKEWVCWSI